MSFFISLPPLVMIKSLELGMDMAPIIVSKLRADLS